MTPLEASLSFKKLFLGYLLPLAVSSAVVGQVAAPSRELRVWTDDSGQHKKAAVFLKEENGVVHLGLPNGDVLPPIPLDRLSEPDQEYVRRVTDEEDDDQDPSGETE